jgi:hypothetical protein
MAFIRRRKTGAGWSHQAIETYREGGKVHQRVLANLGPYSGVDAALMGLRETVARCERRLSFCVEQAWKFVSAWGKPPRMELFDRTNCFRVNRNRNALARLESDMEKFPQLCSVKEFVVEPKLPDTTLPSAPDGRARGSSAA